MDCQLSTGDVDFPQRTTCVRHNIPHTIDSYFSMHTFHIEKWKMTSLLRFSFMVDNLHYLLDAYYHVWQNNIKTIRTLHQIMRQIIARYSMWNIQKSQCMWKVHLSSTFFFWECCKTTHRNRDQVWVPLSSKKYVCLFFGPCLGPLFLNPVGIIYVQLM